MRYLYYIGLIAVVLMSCQKVDRSNYRYVKDISQQDWCMWLDKEAEWEDDQLYLPPLNVDTLPTNPPTIGWDELQARQGVEIELPATVEEYHWGDNGNHFGTAGNYVGVSWFTKKLTIPEKLRNKRIVLHFQSARMRAEIYVNRKLAGYNLIDSTPFVVAIDDDVNYGEENFIAVRITDPNGNFTWCDWPLFKWGEYKTIPSHGFGGITGKVKMIATDKTYIEDVFVKNKPAITEVDVQVDLNTNLTSMPEGRIKFTVKEHNSQKVVWIGQKRIKSQNPDKYVEKISCENAKLWSPDNPFLYDINV